jgi:hypothetical protein
MSGYTPEPLGLPIYDAMQEMVVALGPMLDQADTLEEIIAIIKTAEALEKYFRVTSNRAIKRGIKLYRRSLREGGAITRELREAKIE